MSDLITKAAKDCEALRLKYPTLTASLTQHQLCDLAFLMTMAWLDGAAESARDMQKMLSTTTKQVAA